MTFSMLANRGVTASIGSEGAFNGGSSKVHCLFGASGNGGQGRDGARLLAGPEFANRLLSVGAWLVEESDLPHGARKVLLLEILAHLERVESGSHHEGELVVEKMTDSADLALEAEPRAQHAGPG